MCVGIMHAEAGRDLHDRGLQDLVGELSTQSETFRRLWADHNVRTQRAGTKRFEHPVVGELTLAYEELATTAEPASCAWSTPPNPVHRPLNVSARSPPGQQPPTPRLNNPTSST